MHPTMTQPLCTLTFSRTRDGRPVMSITRRDGTVAWQKQDGFFPLHDLTHFAVETVLGIREGFLGMMADGWELADFGTPWPRGPMPNPRDALLAEASVGAFGLFAQSSGDDAEAAAALNAHLADYCARHGHDPPRAITADEFARIRRMREELHQRWLALAPREAMELEFRVG